MRWVRCAPLLFMFACSPTTTGIEGKGDDAGETGDGDGECVLGQLDCVCTSDGGCDAGLACVADMCVPEGGDGDGDGDGGGDGDGDGDGDGPCTGLGCECDGAPESCDAPLMCIDGGCKALSCGNGALDNNEQCDDGNNVDGDGCDNDCSHTQIDAIVAGGFHTCALIEGGRLRCWGEGLYGVTGYGNTENIGDNESPASAGDVPLPGAVVNVDVGDSHVCAELNDDGLRCWGSGVSGQLGYANTMTVGDDESLEDLAALDIGGAFSQFAIGDFHGCVRYSNSEFRCWGLNNDGQLGLGHTNTIGNDEHPIEAGVVFLGVQASTVAAGGAHSCAITGDLQLRCWGQNARGQLGYGNNAKLGDNETPSTVGDIDLFGDNLSDGAKLAKVSLGKEHSCALFSTGEVVCWGENGKGQLGQGNNTDYGDSNGEFPANLTPISLDGAATAISAGGDHTCALLVGGAVRCWGANTKGQLGLGDANISEIGIDELPSEVGVVELGGNAIAISAGGNHSCALLNGFEVVCWGDNVDGRLGYAHTNTIGDDEVPATAGTVDVL